MLTFHLRAPGKSGVVLAAQQTRMKKRKVIKHSSNAALSSGLDTTRWESLLTGRVAPRTVASVGHDSAEQLDNTPEVSDTPPLSHPAVSTSKRKNLKKTAVNSRPAASTNWEKLLSGASVQTATTGEGERSSTKKRPRVDRGGLTRKIRTPAISDPGSFGKDVQQGEGSRPPQQSSQPKGSSKPGKNRERELTARHGDDSGATAVAADRHARGKRPRPVDLNLAFQAAKAAKASEQQGPGSRDKTRKNRGQEKAIAASEKSRFVAMDCEMVGVGLTGNRSALARCCLVGWDGQLM